jgi:GTP-binding protein
MNRTVAIVGRPNVGKSTLFNRLIGERKAIIDDISGVTRDRIYGDLEWNGMQFDLIDTGGYVTYTDDVFEKAIKEQVKIAIEEAKVILFIVDVSTGITDLDDSIADMLRKSNKKVLLVVNKVDNTKRLHEISEFYSLGFEELFPLSSISGSGTGEILDAIVENLPAEEKLENEDKAYDDFDEDEEKEPEIPRVAIIGQPNVGKSSMVNALMGEERNIVTNVAGTTRDSIHSTYNKFGKEFTLVDTAGIRKKTKVSENLEFYSVIRAIKAVEEADIVMIMIDAKTGLEAQDMALFKLVQRRKKGILLVVNKWDNVEKETNTMRDYEEQLRVKLAPHNDIPILFTSVLEKQRIFNVLNLLFDIFSNMKKRIVTRELNDVMLKVIEKTPPPSYRGNMIKIKYITQLHAKNPTFAFFCNHPKYLPDNYKNFLKNKLRESFDFKGVLINLIFKEK